MVLDMLSLSRPTSEFPEVVSEDINRNSSFDSAVHLVLECNHHLVFFLY